VLWCFITNHNLRPILRMTRIFTHQIGRQSYSHQLEPVSCAMALPSPFYILFFSPFYRVRSAKDRIHFMTNSARQIFTMTTVRDDFDVSTSLTDSFHVYFALSLPSFSWHLHYIRSGSSPVWVRSHPLSFTPQSSTII